MDSMEVNKAFAAVLVAGITFMVSGLVADIVVHPKQLDKTVLKIETSEPAAPVAAKEEPIAVLLASADAERGAAAFKSVGCVACHTPNEGGKNGVGPNLYGVVGEAIGKGANGYAFSAALSGKGGNWDFDKLNEWLTKPAAFAPGTKMTFAGLADSKKRADIIMYLRSLSAHPVALPAAPAQAAAATPAAAAPAPAAPAAAAAAAPAGPALKDLLASANPDEGKKLTSSLGCIACHTFNEGGKNGLGPNLYGVVGEEIAKGAGGFNFSDALKKHTGTWTFDQLDAWLTKPGTYAPGTRMIFPGIPDAKKRADVIAYLRSLSANPVKLP